MWLVLAASSLTPPRAWRLPPGALRAGSAAVCEADGGGGGGEQNARSIPPPLPEATDPFVLLGLNHSSAGDIAAIKSAYHRLTKARHPDSLVTASTPVQLRQRIHDDFSRVNAAYEELRSNEGLPPPPRRGPAAPAGKPPRRWYTQGGAGDVLGRARGEALAAAQAAAARAPEAEGVGMGTASRWAPPLQPPSTARRAEAEAEAE
eukprot:CAMPEP_0185517022 /NCGR_PEP_ID=MMETSP1366-20130426/67307_1 /TAXON_ID=38817 /ORGANISM="Gephyrocapsa oceanica, Strain RCC1303" /LENGTH=204 /DNA_ID=CAMNT_0028127957 /DNA_START=14 /DNA_END=626 /DNA_ORIENTATION=-